MNRKYALFKVCGLQEYSGKEKEAKFREKMVSMYFIHAENY
jgi:hypothetical protein